MSLVLCLIKLATANLQMGRLVHVTDVMTT